MGLINMRDVVGMNLNFLYLPLTLPKIFATDAFFIFLLVQFMRGIPKDLDESATLDGCGKIGIYFRIIIPLSTAALVTTALFSFLWSWDDYFNQLLYVHDTMLYTVPIVLRTFISTDSVSDWGASLAMSVISIIPCFILFFSLQKYFVQGIATTGIKG
jgi:multiple sugar transport system permease protein